MLGLDVLPVLGGPVPAGRVPEVVDDGGRQVRPGGEIPDAQEEVVALEDQARADDVAPPPQPAPRPPLVFARPSAG
jgi:hypothetical protein